MLKGLDKAIAHEIKLFVKMVDDPLTAVARVAALCLKTLIGLKVFWLQPKRRLLLIYEKVINKIRHYFYCSRHWRCF